MSIDVDLYKTNYDELVENLMKYCKTDDRKLLTSILEQFGEHIGDYYIQLHNEYYEDGICTWNVASMINEVFDVEDSYGDVILKLQKDMIGYKEIDEAYENLGLTRVEKDDEDDEESDNNEVI